MSLVVAKIFILYMPDWLEPWVNYPGLELWKFVNLFIFMACAFYLHRRFGRPIRQALRTRGEGIKRELARAQEERNEALAKLAEVDERFAGLAVEVAKIEERARVEGEADRERIALATEQEISRTREQAKKEIESAGKKARHDLRRFAALESVRLAEEILRIEIRPEDDARLTSQTVQQLGRTAS